MVGCRLGMVVVTVLSLSTCGCMVAGPEAV